MALSEILGTRSTEKSLNLAAAGRETLPSDLEAFRNFVADFAAGMKADAMTSDIKDGGREIFYSAD